MRSIIVVDTDVLIDLEHNHAPWLKILLEEKTQQLVLPTIVISEYWAATKFVSLKDQAEAEDLFSLFDKQDLTEPIAKKLGILYRQKTYTTGASTADLIIAATVIYLNGLLATRNRTHFTKIPNLHFFDTHPPPGCTR